MDMLRLFPLALHSKVLEMIPGLADKISAKINKKAPTDEEMDAVNDFKDSLGDEEFKLED